MSTIEAEVYAAFKSVGMPDDEAMKSAAALNCRGTDIANVKNDIVLLKWMVTLVIGLDVVIMMKPLVH